MPQIRATAALDHVIEDLAKAVLDHFTHRPTPAPGLTDVNRANLAAYLGERLGPVLVRLRQAEQQVDMLRTPAAKFHSKAYIERVTTMFTESITDMAGQQPEVIARAVMQYTETAVYAAEREIARVISLLGAVLADMGSLSTDAVEHALVAGDRLVCPNPLCGGLVVELDWGWRHNLVEVLGPGEIKTHAGVAHFETARNVYECNTCLMRLSLPPSFSVVEHQKHGA